jgi:CO dehydrogenase maturation factor
MPWTIAIAGKGGTGKTTLAALLCRAMLDRAIKPLLAVDADPNSCLPERLGVTVTPAQTIGHLREQLRAEPESVPQGLSKHEWIEKLISEELTEAVGFDLIVMGRQEGPNCYCYINNLLRNCLERMGAQYRATIIDNEAGLEHLSRRTNGRVDVMLVVCQPTFNGARTARNIREIMDSLKLDVRRALLVLNRGDGELPEELRKEFVASGMEISGVVPEDPLLNAYETQRKSLLELPRESNALQAADALLGYMLEGRTS